MGVTTKQHTHKKKKKKKKKKNVSIPFVVKVCFNCIGQTNLSPLIKQTTQNRSPIANGFVSSKIYDKRDDFDFDIVNFLLSGW